MTTNGYYVSVLVPADPGEAGAKHGKVHKQSPRLTWLQAMNLCEQVADLGLSPEMFRRKVVQNRYICDRICR